MLSGDFARNLRKLNRNLRIACGDDPTRPAGLFRVVNGKYINICGIDKNFVRERPTYKPNGEILRSGWRRVLLMLVAEGLIKREAAEKVFNTSLRDSRFNLAVRGQAKSRREGAEVDYKGEF